YVTAHHGSSQHPPQNQKYYHPQSMSGDAGGYISASTQRPSSHSQSTTYVTASSGRPPKSGKHSSQSNVPSYLAGAAGVAGLAAASHHHQHHSSSHSSVSGSPYAAGQMQFSNASRTRVGPLDKFVEFWRDREGVARFEEYTQYIGVCKHCFSPDSSPRDAPRKHHFRKRGSQGKYGSSSRIDKESRYFSSDSDNRRKSGKSWLATGIAGYGLAKIGKSILNQGRDSDDGYNVKSGRARRSTTSFGGRSDINDRRSSHRSRSRDRLETGITSDGKVYKKEHRAGSLGGSTLVTVDPSRHRSRSDSRSRSRSHDRRTGLAGAALGSAIGASGTGSRSRHRSRSNSPDKKFVRKKRRSREASPSLTSIFGLSASNNDRGGRRSSPSSHTDISRANTSTNAGVLGGFFNTSTKKPTKTRRKKSRGFFAWGNGSSSSSDSGLAFGGGFPSRNQSKEHQTKERDRHDTEAIIGLGAAAAAIAASGNRKGKRDSRRADVVAVRASKGRQNRDHQHHHQSRTSSTSSASHDEAWESASDDEDDLSSVDSGLAFGGVYGDTRKAARRSQDSLSSDSSGTSKWGWRWGSKKNKKKDPVYPTQSVSHSNSFAGPVANLRRSN
ncbi:MAG: hypothetical protein AVDCRST_MAG93-5059, partial [uncultured Chloroflexia bacterium]